MRLHRFLKEENVQLDFDPFASPEEDDRWASSHGEEEEELDVEEMSPRQQFDYKVRIIESLVDLLVPSGKITNRKKCITDLRNREAKATTGLGMGIAMPHVRTAQAKDFTIGVAIAPEPGLWFDAIDDEPVRIFFPMVAPPHNDRYYRKVEKALAEAFLNDDEEELREGLLNAQTPGEVIILLRDVIDLS